MNTWLNRGRLRRPGRGLKIEDKQTEHIHPTASHTEIRTRPVVSDSTIQAQGDSPIVFTNTRSTSGTHPRDNPYGMRTYASISDKLL
jgi:hypothetical protein